MAKDTPSSSNSVMSPLKVKAQTAPTQVGLEFDRENMVFDLDETVPEVKTSFFSTHLLPPSPLPLDVSLEVVMEWLRKEGTITKQDTWKGWKSPKLSGPKEDDVFRGFEGFVDRILKVYKPPGKTITTTFKCNPALQLWSHMRTNTSKPDCYGIRSDAKLVHDEATRKNQPRWIDVAVPAEFKKNDLEEDKNDDATKVLWSMNHIMRDDLRRRFVIGFTIENTKVRYWFCSRSDVFVSEEFDMMTNKSELVDFIFRVSFANDHELGWDTSITLYEPSLLVGTGRLRYDIQVRDDAKGTIRTFRTIRLLSNYGADALRGRGTRVWEVIELDKKGKESGKTCVLKDVWVDDDRVREGTILARIHADADAKFAEDPKSIHKSTMDQCLLTVLTYGDVHLNGKADKTRDWDFPNVDRVITVRVDPKASKQVPQSQPAVGGVALEVEHPNPSDGKAKVDFVPYPVKTHHRTVFKEVGKTIREVRSLSNAFTYLQYVTFVLRILHQLGWVHRDISGGNILIVRGLVKLADLEYAKHKDDETMGGVRTGTPYFMSTEVEDNCYLHTHNAPEAPPAPLDDVTTTYNDLFRALPEETDEDDVHETDETDEMVAADESEPSQHSVEPAPTTSVDGDDSEDASEVALSSSDGVVEDTELPQLPAQPKPVTTTVPFKYNPLHDLESIIWLAFYLLLSGRLVTDNDGTSADQLDTYTRTHRALAWKMFNNKSFRITAMVTQNKLAAELNQTSLLKQVRTVAEHLENMRSLLQGTFIKAETTLVDPIPFDIVTDLHKAYHDEFTLIRGVLKKDIKVAVNLASRDLLREQWAKRDEGPKAGSSGTANEDAPADGAEASGTPPTKKQKTKGAGKQHVDLRAQATSGLRRSSCLESKLSSAPAALR